VSIYVLSSGRMWFVAEEGISVGHRVWIEWKFVDFRRAELSTMFWTASITFPLRGTDEGSLIDDGHELTYIMTARRSARIGVFISLRGGGGSRE